MVQVIGFTNKFYTLWNIDNESIYITDSYGKHHLVGYNTHYNYIKNIAFDLSKVRELYPNLDLDENLRGITTSWISQNVEDLCPNIMKFGKYYTKDINDLLVLDFKYLVWACDNLGYSKNLEYIKSLPKIKEYYTNLLNAENKIISEKNDTFNELLVKGFYDFTPTKNLSIFDDIATIYVAIDNIYVSFQFNHDTFTYNEYNGFNYGLPKIKGKGKRMKNKNIRFEFTENKDNEFTVIVNNVIILD